jgi:type IV pilus assembly protein PilQ
MGKGIFLTFLLLSFIWTNLYASEMQAVNFIQSDRVSRLELLLDENTVKAQRFHLPADKQIVLDLSDVTATERVMRAFDTSEFSGSIVFVSAYPKPSNRNDLRVTIQLRDNVRSTLERADNRVILKVENYFGAFAKHETGASQTLQAAVSAPVGERINIPKSEKLEDILHNLTLSGQKRYVGKRITINVKNLKIDEILNMISDASGFNIILTDEIKRLKPLSLRLRNTPWDQALDTILELNKLVAQKNGAILIINTLKQATNERRVSLEAKTLALRQEPLVTKIFHISFASTSDLTKTLKAYSTPERGSISIDERTSALIVKDTADTIEKIRKIIEVLDTQTPQVLIESKIVEVTEAYKKEIGLQQGIGFGYDPIGIIGDGVPNAVGAGVGQGVDGGPGFTISSAPSTGDGARTLFGLSISRFGRLTNLNFALQLMESESKGKVVASPKVITQNKKAATISSSDTTSFAITTGTGETASTSFQQVSANLSLVVTPQVTSEGSILLGVQLSKDAFSVRPSASAPPNMSNRKIDTNVLVDNGSTIVIGGIYTFAKSESHSGIPFLKDIPLIGWLFRTPYAPESSKSELIIFITPRVINQEEAGLVEQS